MATNLRSHIQLNAALARYGQALAAPQSELLAVLLARDQVEVALQQSHSLARPTKTLYNAPKPPATKKAKPPPKRV